MLLLNPSESSMSFLQKRSSPGPVTGFAVFVAGSWQIHGRPKETIAPKTDMK
jgi:hypothetical protein